MQIFMKKFDNYLEYLFDLCYCWHSVSKLISQFLGGKSSTHNCNKLSVKNKIYLYIVFLADKVPPLKIKMKISAWWKLATSCSKHWTKPSETPDCSHIIDPIWSIRYIYRWILSWVFVVNYVGCQRPMTYFCHSWCIPLLRCFVTSK